ncbi:hypothetical protein BXO88_02915 [Oribacterium sp. C9]|uniref:hypothetical protein n=1 Tax=Oribacterium sp. C9 TaxID=1943579 RepID=UPI00098FC69A|nr:hypothetical protein [Oribacterium sp. C9]OON87642.1 hypothetical protein BXO88_02915 [Oribacterium sp. C9]
MDSSVDNVIYSNSKKEGASKSPLFDSNEMAQIDAGKDGKLIRILNSISNSEDISQDLNNIMISLKDIYGGKYRHSYYSISLRLYMMDEKQLYNLTTGMNLIREKINKNDTDTYAGVRKLYDHIQLEIVRICENNDRKKELNKISERSINTLKKEARIFDNHIKESTNNIYTQIIGILGIFAAIVIVFFGGASVFSNVFANLDKIKWLAVMPVICAVGFIMFNLIFMFLFIVSRMIDKDIGAKLPDEYQNKDFISKFTRRYPYIVFFNVIIFLVFIITVA